MGSGVLERGCGPFSLSLSLFSFGATGERPGAFGGERCAWCWNVVLLLEERCVVFLFLETVGVLDYFRRCWSVGYVYKENWFCFGLCYMLEVIRWSE